MEGNMSKFVVIEGTDCSGKETQSKLLVQRLNDSNIKAVYVTFPMYDTPTGKIIGGPYLGKKEICEGWFPEGACNVDPQVASLYFAADRKNNLPKLKEYLNNGYFVICDRYTSSNMAHQGGKIEDENDRFNMYQWLNNLEYWLLGLPKPDMTIFLYVPYEYSLELKKNRKNLDQHEVDEQHEKSAERAYIELSKLYNWDRIDCIESGKMRSKEDINEEIYGIVEKKMIKSLE